MLKITIENYLRLLLRLALVGTLMIILGSWLVQPHLKRFLELEKAPGLPMLIPGVGKQGGDLKKSLKNGNTDGISIINVSRSIIFPTDLTEKSIRNEAKGYLEK